MKFDPLRRQRLKSILEQIATGETHARSHRRRPPGLGHRSAAALGLCANLTLKARWCKDTAYAYLEAATNSGESRAFIEKRIRTTAGQSGISGGDIKAMPVPICSYLEQAEIVLILEEKFKVTEAIESQIEAALVDAEVLRRSILRKAFSGELVEQDPSDEPAAVLLERIKAEKASQKPKTKPRKRQVASA